MNIAIFASGKGSNAEKIIERVGDRVKLVVSTKKEAGVVGIAEKFNIPVIIPNKKSFYETENILSDLQKINFIVLAGFLWLVPSYLIKKFPKKIINIHPALLPKFGGKGMYGMNVHKAVIDAKEKESGITIHYVNEQYDEGEIIFQAKCNVSPDETPETLAQKIHTLEHKHFPETVEKIILEK